MQICDWVNVLICHVREWKHQKHSPWACLFLGVKFCGTSHFQKIIFLHLLQIWSSYCFHCDTDQLWTHTQSNNKTKCLKHILFTVKNPTPHLCTFWHKVIIYGASHNHTRFSDCSPFWRVQENLKWIIKMFLKLVLNSLSFLSCLCVMCVCF